MSDETTRVPEAGLAGVCAVAVMAKAPRPGRVKTRLQSAVSPEEAARLGAAFLSDVTANLALAAQSAPIHPFVAYAPAGNEAAFDGVVAPGTRLVLADGTGGDGDGVEGFGRVLHGAMRSLLARGYGAVGVLNADSPTLPTGYLSRAAGLLLSGTPAVLGPAEDGGYYFLGLRAPASLPFARIHWSTGTVAEETRARLREAGLRAVELPPWFDVDDPPALRRLLSDGQAVPGTEFAPPFAAPATRACIAAIGLHARIA